MRIPEYAQQHKVAFNMTPMIDVVFLLIIFFLVSSHLARRENRVPLDLPLAASGEKDTDTSRRITINVLPNSELNVGGEPVPWDQLGVRLSAAKASLGENLELRIRCDRSVAYRNVVPVLRSAAEQNIWNVTFAVVQQTQEAP
ncbi:MAG: biopolymer transporter ExbD [Pirellulaceae bacterium]